MDEMQVYIFIRSRSSKNRLLNTQRYRLVRVCAVSRDMVYIYITAWNERTDGNSMGLTTYAIMYNQRVIIYVAKCEPARELGTWALNDKSKDKIGLSIFVEHAKF